MTTISRRRFVQLGSLASASLFIPQFLKAFEKQQSSSRNGKVLVVVQLSGGNDGLNTIIPFRNDIYYSGRPKISIDRQSVLSLTDKIGINPSLKNLKGFYDDGTLSIINGVGYPHPNRSHFRSMDIWQTGSAADELVTTGWIGRYLDNACADCDLHNCAAIELDDTLSLAMKGADKKAIAVKDIDRFYRAANDRYFQRIATHADEHKEHLAGYLYKTLRETNTAAGYIYQQSKIYASNVAYPDTQIGKRMKTIGSLMVANGETSVYYVSHGSFDTHADQRNRQDKLLAQLDDALAALVTDLKLNNRFHDVLIMTFSEFGRRVAENASTGTDHGTANSMLLLSGALKKPGLYNDLPSLTDLDEGDLKYEVDFKRVYATVLDKWLQVKGDDVLGQQYEHLSFV
jgi:uncharacterized protein (DUF1501 family)